MEMYLIKFNSLFLLRKVQFNPIFQVLDLLLHSHKIVDEKHCAEPPANVHGLHPALPHRIRCIHTCSIESPALNNIHKSLYHNHIHIYIRDIRDLLCTRNRSLTYKH